MEQFSHTMSKNRQELLIIDKRPNIVGNVYIQEEQYFHGCDGMVFNWIRKATKRNRRHTTWQIDTLRFINAKKREEFEMIVQGNEYLQSVFETLNIISQDEQKRLEYTARKVTLYNKNEYAFENYERGKNEMKSELIAKWEAKGMIDEQIKELLN